MKRAIKVLALGMLLSGCRIQAAPEMPEPPELDSPEDWAGAMPAELVPLIVGAVVAAGVAAWAVSR